jgi:hypothetical protein
MNITFTGPQFIIAILIVIGMFYGALKALVPGIAIDAMNPIVQRLEKDITHIDATFKLLMETEIKRLREDTKYIRDQLDIHREKEMK